jgi:sugar O-acyltransferase (sialic acid O-acetyltransferase NeuD family)
VECVLYGIGSTFVEATREGLERLGWVVRGGVENVQADFRPDGLRIVRADAVPPSWLELPVVLPVMTPGYRRSLEREALELGFRRLATVVDPTAVVASTVSFGAGAVVIAGTVIGAHTELSRLTAVNRAVSIGHHVRLDEYASLGPGAVVCGQTTIGRGAFVGAGAVLCPSVTIGANAVVGAGAVVLRDVPPHTLVVGNPARVVKEVAGFNDVSVDDLETPDRGVAEAARKPEAPEQLSEWDEPAIRDPERL